MFDFSSLFLQSKQSMMNAKRPFLEFKKSNKEAHIYLYKQIGQHRDDNRENWDEIIDIPSFLKELDQLRSQNCSKFVYHVNCEGGEVAQGQAFVSYHVLHNDNVEWIVEGIAASMGAVMMLNPNHKVRAWRHAMLMYHRVKGGLLGDASELKNYASMLEKFESGIIDMAAKRMKCSAEFVEQKFFSDGKDHWITATEAKELGLVDEIFDTEDQNFKETEPKAIYNYCLNKFNINSKPKKMAKKLLEVLNLAEDASEAAQAAAVEAIIRERDDAKTKVVNLTTRNTELETQVTLANEAKISAVINQAISDKKITEEDRVTYTDLAKKDFDNTVKVINKLPGVGRVVNQLNQDVPEAEKSWTFDDYFKANKLENLKATNRARFDQLYQAKFNKPFKG